MLASVKAGVKSTPGQETGRPGPSTWQGGTYPEGQDDYPVSGVCWYEAAAYAKYADKSLPTIYHWLGATDTHYATYLIPLSNFRNQGIAAGFSSPAEAGRRC